MRSLIPGCLVVWVVVLSIHCAPAAPPRSPVSAAPAAPATGPTRAERHALRARGMVAYDRKEYAACAALLEQAHELYSAACCHARAGAYDAAFAALDRAIDQGLHDHGMEGDADLEALHADPRWQATLTRLSARIAEYRRTLNPKLAELYDQDQADRNTPVVDQIDWTKVAPRDEARRKRVDEILAHGGAKAADDYYHAAMIYQHGDSPGEIQRAHDLAVKAVELDPTHDAAKWLAAASEDRKLMYEHKPQKWGTQYKKVDGKWIVWPVDPTITDAQRDAWNVPPLAEAQAEADRLNAAMNATAGAPK